MLNFTRTHNGSAYLHIWREGEEYFQQKSDKFLPEWTNIRFVATSEPPVKNIYFVDLSKNPLDFFDNTFDAVNAYHVLEHLTPNEGQKFVKEIFRVLKHNGIFRTSTPDLQSICREYLRQLEIARENPTSQNIQRYRWSVMRIFDQMVREKVGGMMLDALRNGDYDREYLDQMFGDCFRPIIESVQQTSIASERKTFRSRLTRLTPRAVYEGLRRRYREYKIRDQRHPILSKERDEWLYDIVSVTLLMRSAGFVRVQQQDYKHSDIPDWSRYDLDCSNIADRAIDPSVYVEGHKPDRANWSNSNSAPA
jgi:predicted SAM-dependent methyltransferase